MLRIFALSAGLLLAATAGAFASGNGRGGRRRSRRLQRLRLPDRRRAGDHQRGVAEVGQPRQGSLRDDGAGAGARDYRGRGRLDRRERRCVVGAHQPDAGVGRPAGHVRGAVERLQRGQQRRGGRVPADERPDRPVRSQRDRDIRQETHAAPVHYRVRRQHLRAIQAQRGKLDHHLSAHLPEQAVAR